MELKTQSSRNYHPPVALTVGAGHCDHILLSQSPSLLSSLLKFIFCPYECAFLKSYPWATHSVSDLWLCNKCPDLEAPNTESSSVLDQCHWAVAEAAAPSILPLLTVTLISVSGGHMEPFLSISYRNTRFSFSCGYVSHIPTWPRAYYIPGNKPGLLPLLPHAWLCNTRQESRALQLATVIFC